MKKLSLLFTGSETLAIINNVIADGSVNKWRQSLLELFTSDSYCDHCLWFLKQSYLTMPKNLRRQVRAIFIWYPTQEGRSYENTQ